MNQVIIAYHVLAHGEIVLSPELAEYKLMEPAQIKCWPAGTGRALADWLRSRGIEPQCMELPPPASAAAAPGPGTTPRIRAPSRTAHGSPQGTRHPRPELPAARSSRPRRRWPT